MLSRKTFIVLLSISIFGVILAIILYYITKPTAPANPINTLSKKSLYQTCSANSDCDNGLICEGRCVRPLAGPCNTIYDCTKNATSCTGFCEASGNGEFGEPCPCKDGYQCATDPSNSSRKICLKIPGSPCNATSECATQSCIGAVGDPYKTCQDPLTNGQTCTFNENCASSNCSLGYCQPLGVTTGTITATCGINPTTEAPLCNSGLRCGDDATCKPQIRDFNEPCDINNPCKLPFVCTAFDYSGVPQNGICSYPPRWLAGDLPNKCVDGACPDGYTCDGNGNCIPVPVTNKKFPCTSLGDVSEGLTCTAQQNFFMWEPTINEWINFPPAFDNTIPNFFNYTSIGVTSATWAAVDTPDGSPTITGGDYLYDCFVPNPLDGSEPIPPANTLTYTDSRLGLYQTNPLSVYALRNTGTTPYGKILSPEVVSSSTTSSSGGITTDYNFFTERYPISAVHAPFCNNNQYGVLIVHAASRTYYQGRSYPTLGPVPAFGPWSFYNTDSNWYTELYYLLIPLNAVGFNVYSFGHTNSYVNSTTLICIGNINNGDAIVYGLKNGIIPERRPYVLYRRITCYQMASGTFRVLLDNNVYFEFSYKPTLDVNYNFLINFTNGNFLEYIGTIFIPTFQRYSYDESPLNLVNGGPSGFIFGSSPSDLNGAAGTGMQLTLAGGGTLNNYFFPVSPPCSNANLATCYPQIAPNSAIQDFDIQIFQDNWSKFRGIVSSIVTSTVGFVGYVMFYYRTFDGKVHKLPGKFSSGDVTYTGYRNFYVKSYSAYV